MKKEERDKVIKESGLPSIEEVLQHTVEDLGSQLRELTIELSLARSQIAVMNQKREQEQVKKEEKKETESNANKK